MDRSTTKATKYYDNLDLLRFFLAVTVIIYHIPAITLTVLHVTLFDKLPIFHKGAEAVYCFFTLSGYLITRLLIKEKAAFNDINLKLFYMRRVLRIWPVYFLVFIVGMLYYHVVLPKMGMPGKDNYSVPVAILLCVFFLSNVFQKLFATGSILAIMWSIGVEEQFYLVWPVIFKKMRLNNILLFLAALYLVIFLYNFFNPKSILLEFRFLFDFMIIGGITSILIDKHHQLAIAMFLAWWFRITAVLLFAIMFFTNLLSFVQEWNQQAYDLLCGIISVSFIIALTYLPSLKQLKKATYFGKISYGIYMYHMIIVNLVLFIALKLRLAAHFSANQLFFIINVSVIIITMVAAHISYKYFETYFLSLKDKFTKIKSQSAPA